MSYSGMMMPGDGSNPPDNSNTATEPDGDDQQGTATTQAAYVAPTDGQPTICQNCVHFDGQGACDHPQVIADPQVNGKVDANGHSKFYTPKSGQSAELGAATKKPALDAGIQSLAAGARYPKQSTGTFGG